MIVLETEGYSGHSGYAEYGNPLDCKSEEMKRVKELVDAGKTVHESILAQYKACVGKDISGKTGSFDFSDLITSGTEIAKAGLEGWLKMKTNVQVAQVQSDAYSRSLENLARIQQQSQLANPYNQAKAANPTIPIQDLIQRGLLGPAQTGKASTPGIEYPADIRVPKYVITKAEAPEVKEKKTIGDYLPWIALTAAVAGGFFLFTQAKKEDVPVREVAMRYLPGK